MKNKKERNEKEMRGMDGGGIKSKGMDRRGEE